MRILVTSTLYPPIVAGGYELECSAVVDRLRATHDVLVLTSDVPAADEPDGPLVRRRLPQLTPDPRGALRAPAAAVTGVREARRALAWKPDLVYAWNGAGIPQAALRVLADAGVPMAFRVCEHWFGRLFTGDQFLRELLPAPRTPPRRVWAAGCRTFNRLPSLRLDPLAPMRAAISWNAHTLRAQAGVPPMVRPVLESVTHPVPRDADTFAAVQRRPARDPEVAFVGRLSPEKGVDVAIDALALLRERHATRATLAVAGPAAPDDVRRTRERARRRGVDGAVRWLGPLPAQGVADLLAGAHALIVPSVWEEPFGLVTIEGALARVPLVASDVGGISEGVEHERHALLVAPGDPEAAAAALARVLSEPAQTEARVRRAYEHAQRFRLDAYLDEQERFVADAVAALSGAP